MAIKMNATNYLNESILSDSLSYDTALITNDINYCVLSTLHGHPYDAYGRQQQVASLNDGRDIYLLNKKIGGQDLDQKASVQDNKVGQAHQQQLDPYIDAVQVKNRVNNRRGARVKAATNQQLTATSRPSDHEPKSSYYSKTVHIEEQKEAHDKWDYSSGDSSDDDDDEDDHHHHKKSKKYHHHRHQKHKHHHGGHHGKKYGHHKPKGKKKVYKMKKYKKPKTKVVYVKVEKEPKKKNYKKHYEKHDHDYHHYDDKDHHHSHYHHDKYHDDYSKKKHHDDHHHYSGKSKGKLVHLDLMGKGKMSLAGVLGYTLLCVNYLLVLKQPTYDKYGSHYYSKYKPPHGHSHGGPVILAHCGELPDQTGLIHLASTPNSSTVIEDFKAAVNATTSKRLEAAEQQRDDQQLLYLRDRSRQAANSPPSYYYTINRNDQLQQQQHSLASYRAGQPMSNPNHYNNHHHRGILAPLQNALNRLFLLPGLSSTNNNLDDDSDNDARLAGLQVVSRPPMQGQRQLLIGNNNNNNNNNNNGQRGVVTTTGNTVLLNGPNNAIRATQSAALINANGRPVILVNGQPQVVQTRDNLVEMRTRQIQIGLRIAEGRRFGLPQRQLSLVNPNSATLFDHPPPLGVAVRAPDSDSLAGAAGQLQNDQPSSSADNNNRPNANQIVVDLPEYALAGDSIELTCNHRMAMNRLLSVRWFKDSLEFYRFVPVDMRPKTGFFLPDVQLDLARSTLQSVYLRNVTHRTSGLYRCEVISEAPTFEMMSGERQMRVYALPDTGPQLTLLDRTQLLRLQQPRLLVNGRRVFTGEREFNGANDDNNQEDDDDDGLLPTALSLDGRRRAQLQVAVNAGDRNQAGPVIRCTSDRSNPVGQLRFFINNQPVSVSRTLENSTLSYSDGLESNLVSFRVQLSDFVFSDSSSGLDRAASLSSDESKNKTDTMSKTTTTTTTTTTTSTTPKPNLSKVKLSKNKSTGKADSNKKQTDKKKKNNKKVNPNAGVQFDDENSPKSRTNNNLDNRKDKSNETRANNNNNNKKENKKEKSGNRKSNVRSNMETDKHNLGDEKDKFFDSINELHEANMASLGETVHHLLTSQEEPVKMDGQPSEAVDNISSGVGRRMQVAESGSMQSHEQIKSIKRRNINASLITGNDKLDEADQQRSGRSSDNNELMKEEQNGARTITSRINSLRTSNDQQQQQAQVYANFIRIKCAASVPSLGYEMTSELNVPLTLLVPASQLSDTLTRQAAASSAGEATNTRMDRPARDRAATRRNDDDGGGGGGSSSQSPGGSLQTPRAVSIDRVAQASGPPRKLFYNPGDMFKKQREPSPPATNHASSTPTIDKSLFFLLMCSLIFVYSFNAHFHSN